MIVELTRKSELLRGLLDFVFPPICPGCESFIETESEICNRCLSQIDQPASPICLTCLHALDTDRNCSPTCKEQFALYYLGDYGPPLKSIIIQLKFSGVTAPAPTLAGLCADRFGDAITALKADCLVPIPLHSGRRNRRGYNQAAILAASFGKRTGLPLRLDLLWRLKRRQPQSLLRLEDRASNIDGVFAVAEAKVEDGARRVILVDDVVTSGATVTEARRVLGKAGYSVPAVVAIAHAGFSGAV